MKKIVILGATGSIGKSAIDVCKNKSYDIVALSCNSSYELILKQYYDIKPSYLAIEDQYSYEIVKEQLKNENVVIYSKGGSQKIAAEVDYDIILNAIVGRAGLLSSVAAAKSGKRLAIANKESLVIYGETLMKIAKDNNTEVIPVDSEHSAIFQCLNGENSSGIKKIILTASGGPFRKFQKSDIQKAKASSALKHPNWSMGNKITIDSATMMNKGLELIEAMRLFDVEAEKIQILVHPESIVHSGVMYNDNSLIAQLSLPDMRLPIQYAFDYPERCEATCKELDLSDIANLSFERPDLIKFPCLKLAVEVAKKGGFYPCIMNVANEFAVSLYLQDKITFYKISDIIEEALCVDFVGDYTKLDDLLICQDYIQNCLIEKYNFG